jgi:site-specific DNA-methyltransferase (adenine-specific)
MIKSDAIVYQTERVVLLKGDCLEVMEDIPNDLFDGIFTDLPYGTTACKWDTIIPFEPLWKNYARLIKDNRAVALNASQPFTSLLVTSNLDLYKYNLVWKKNVATGFHLCNIKPMSIHEDICIFGRGKLLYNPQMTAGKPYVQKRKPVADFGEFLSSKTTRIDTINNGERYPLSVLEFNREIGLHPTQKPVKLLEWLIKTYTNAGDIILDSCAGSGTSLIAALRTGRRAVGIEKDARYCEEIIKRLNGEQKHDVDYGRK